MRSIQKGRVDVAHYLIEHCKVDVEARDCSEMTPLLMASANGHSELVQFLIEHGGAVVEVTEHLSGCTPLHMAAMHPSFEIVK